MFAHCSDKIPACAVTSAVRRPVDLLDVNLVEALSVEWACARSLPLKLVEAHLAEHVAAGKEHFHIIAIVGAAAACHLWLPQRVFHAGHLQVHPAHAQLTRRL